jgi:hypothetical protein
MESSILVQLSSIANLFSGIAFNTPITSQQGCDHDYFITAVFLSHSIRRYGYEIDEYPVSQLQQSNSRMQLQPTVSDSPCIPRT